MAAQGAGRRPAEGGRDARRSTAYAARAACSAVVTSSVVLWRRQPPAGVAVAAAALTVQAVLRGEAPVLGGLLAMPALTDGVARTPPCSRPW